MIAAKYAPNAAHQASIWSPGIHPGTQNEIQEFTGDPKEPKSETQDSTRDHQGAPNETQDLTKDP